MSPLLTAAATDSITTKILPLRTATDSTNTKSLPLRTAPAKCQETYNSMAELPIDIQARLSGGSFQLRCRMKKTEKHKQMMLPDRRITLVLL